MISPVYCILDLIAASLVVSRVVRAGTVSVLGLMRTRGPLVAEALAVETLSNVAVSFLSFV